MRIVIRVFGVKFTLGRDGIERAIRAGFKGITEEELAEIMNVLEWVYETVTQRTLGLQLAKIVSIVGTAERVEEE